MRSTTDFVVRSEGSLVLVEPMTQDATSHILKVTDATAQWFAGALVVEWRYAPSLVEQLIADGFTVQNGCY
jgi:hypothetical protein